MIKQRIIKEGLPGTSRMSPQNIVPANASKLSFQTPSYEFYFHDNDGQKTLYINLTSYHPGILEIPLEKLEELITFLRVA